MKHTLRRTLQEKAHEGEWVANLALEQDAEVKRLRAEVMLLKRAVEVKDTALRAAVAEFNYRGKSPWLPSITCEEALRFALKKPRAGRKP